MSLRLVLGIALVIVGDGCGSKTPCTEYHVVRTIEAFTAKDKQIQSLGVRGGTYEVELDDGHVYRTGYGDKPPRTGETAKLCDVVSKTDASHNYSIELIRSDADGNAKIREATLVR